MRIKASVGVFAGLACLTASAVVRRYDEDTTCTTTTTDRSPMVVTVPQVGSSATSDGVLTVTVPAGTPGMPGYPVSSSAVSASVLTFTLSAGAPGVTGSSVTSSVNTASVLTVTVPAGNAGTPGFPSGSSDASAPVFTVTLSDVNPGNSGSSVTSETSSLDTTCTSSDILLTVNPSTSAASGPITVTVTEIPTGPTPGISTVTVPVVTVTLPGPPPPGWPFGSSSAATVPGVTTPSGPLVTLTIPVGNGGSSSDITVTVPLASVLPSSTPAVTAPQPTGPAGSVVTVTIPEGSGHTATIVLTITVPDGSLDNWSTIITAPGEAGTPTGQAVTVTALTTPASVVTPFPSNGASGSSVDTTCASLTLGLSSSGAASWVPITMPPPQATGSGNVPGGSESPLTITYTLPMESGMTAPFTGVMTITLSPPESAPVSNGPFASWPTGSPMPTFGHHSSPSVGPAVPPGLQTTCSSANVITYTIPAMGTYPPFTGTLTLSAGAPLTETGTSPAILTLTSTVSAGSQGSPNGQSGSPSFTTGFPGPITTTLLGETLTIVGPTPASGPSAYTSQGAGSGHPTKPSNGESSASSTENSVFTVTLPGGQGISSGASVTVPASGNSATGSVQSEETLTLSFSGLPGLLTVTIPEASGSPGFPDGGYTGANTGSLPAVFTVTQSVTPHATLTSPFATGSGESGATPSVIAVTYTVPAGPGGTESLYTVTYTELSPSTSGSGTSPSEVPGYGSPDFTPVGGSSSAVKTVTIGQSGSSVATPSSASGPAVVTLTNGSGSLTVLTLTPKQSLTSTKASGSGNSPITVTVTDVSGSPATITSVVSSASQPGAGATPVTFTFTDASGSPHVVTLTLTGANQPSTVTSVAPSVSTPGSGTSPLTVTITDSNGLPHTVTLTLSGEGSVPTETSAVPGYGNGGDNGGSTPSVITVTPLSGTPFVATVTLSGGAVPTSTPESSDHFSAVTIEEFSTLTFGTASLLTATLSGSPIVFTIPVATPSTQSGRPVTMTIPLTGASTHPTGAAGSTPTVLTVTPASGAPFVVTIPLGGSSATGPSATGSPSVITVPLNGETSTAPAGYGATVPGSGSPSGSVITVTLDSGSTVVLTIPVGGHSATASGVHPITVTETVASTPTNGLGNTASLITLTLPSGSPIVLTIPLNGGSRAVPTATGPAGYGGSPATMTAPSVVTSAPAGSNGHGTVSVSGLTLTETVPIGTEGSVTVVQVTTEVTLGPGNVGKSTSVSTLVLTPTVITYTMPGAYGQDGTVLTVTTDVPVSNQSPSVEVLTFTLPTSPATPAAQDGLTVTTIWPGGSTSAPGVSPIVITVEPTASGAAPSFITSSSTCTSDGDASAVQPDQGSSTADLSVSVITVFPAASSMDTTCTTFTTLVRSSGKPGSSDPGASGQVSVVTVTLGSGSSTVLTIPLGETTAAQGSSSTCTETSTQTSSTLRTQTVIAVSSVIGTLFPDQATPSSVPLDSATASGDLLPPPQTEFLGAESTQDVSGYTFATAQPAAYGNPVSAYGSSASSTSAEEPVQGSGESTLVTPTIILATSGSASASSADQTTTSVVSTANSTSMVSISATEAVSATASALNATSTEATAPSASLNATSLATESPALAASSTATGANLPSASCGATGDRGQTLITFDDILPSNDTAAGAPVSLDIPSTYHRFQFSNGFSVVDSAASRYAASSGNQMAEYNASAAPVAQISLADPQSNGCFRFDLLGISLGCNSTGADCDFAITGVQWNGTAEITQASKSIQVAGCTESSNCTMLHQMLDSAAASQFTNLTALNISLTVDGQTQAWWADDLSVTWTDNTCEAASCRAVVAPVDIMMLNSRRRFAKRVLRWFA